MGGLMVLMVKDRLTRYKVIIHWVLVFIPDNYLTVMNFKL